MSMLRAHCVGLRDTRWITKSKTVVLCGHRSHHTVEMASVTDAVVRNTAESNDDETDEVPPTPSPCPEIVHALADVEPAHTESPTLGKRVAPENDDAPCEKRKTTNIVIPGTPPPSTAPEQESSLPLASPVEAPLDNGTE